jgi:hypothetical protein
MGIDLEIRVAMQDHWAPSAFVDTGSVHMKMASVGGGHVLIEDCLTRILHSKGPNFNHLCTGLEYFDFFVAPIKQAFLQYNARVYVCTFDCEANKSHRKARTQQLRVQAAKKSEPGVEAYPRNYTGFRTDGIYNSTTQECEVIDLRRLGRSKFLFPKLWEFLLDLLRTDSFLTDDRLLVFEYQSTGPVLLPSDRAWPKEVQKPATLVHNHSEGDPSSAYFCRIFNPLSCIVCSIDSDLIPILTILEGQESMGRPEDDSSPRRDIYWSYSSDRSVNIPVMVRQCTRSTGLSAFQFAMYCILCDTDYVAKNVYAHNFGCLAILNAVRSRKDDLQSLVDAAFMTKNDDERRKNDEDVIARASEYVSRFNSSEDEEELRLLREAIAAADALKKGTDALDALMKKLYSVGRAQHINEEMRRLAPGPVAPKSAMEAVEASEQAAKRVKTKMFEASSSASQSLPSWSELAKKYEKKKRFKLPSRKDLQVSADSILWNARMWSSQAIA